jgi:hypothetical protein
MVQIQLPIILLALVSAVSGLDTSPRGAQLFMQQGLQIEAWLMGSELYGGCSTCHAADREVGRSNLWDTGFIPTFYQVE